MTNAKNAPNNHEHTNRGHGCQIAVALLIGSAETAYFGPRAKIGRKSISKKDDR
jgi:hypothetical protein